MTNKDKIKGPKSGRPKIISGDAKKSSIYISEGDAQRVYKEMEKLNNLPLSQFYRLLTKLYFEEIKPNISLDRLRDMAMDKHYFL